MPDEQAESELLKPLSTAWLEKLDLATRRKKPFQDVADQCMSFYSGAMGWMYEPKHRARFMGADINPKFKICICKAFEMVALYGPSLYYNNPTRFVKPHPRPEITIESMAAGAGLNLEQAQQAQQQFTEMQQAGQLPPLELQQQVFQFQQIQQQLAQMVSQDKLEQAQNAAACDVLQNYLSYTPREQPGGGLMQASQDGVTEALIKGRGLLMPAPYRMPGSNRQLTGCFFKSVDHLLIDPDAESTEFGEAKWMSLDYYEPTWQVERRYRLKPGSIKGNMESSESQGAQKVHPLGNLERERGSTFDLLKYTKIWSIGGVGTRLTGTSKELQRAFDDVVGDYAHIVVATGIGHPLNVSASRFPKMNDEEVRDAFSWPVPYWMDRRWPMAMLDFYRKPRSPWPIAPIAPGLGELTALNVLISAVVQRGWNSSQTIIAFLKSVGPSIKAALNNNNDGRIVVELDEIQKDIRTVISEFQQQDMSFDTWRVIDSLFELFDKRVGLTDLMFGLNAGGVASRTATDVNAKQQQIAIRPDYMAKQVEAWQTDAARMEKLVAYWNGVSGEDVRAILGTAGAALWDQLFANADPETIVREMDCTIEAQSVRKPNKEREVQNMTQIFPAASQEASKHADMTGDTEPLNWLTEQLGKAMDQDLSGMKMGPRVPPPPPPDEAAQAQAEAEIAKQQAEIQLKQLDMRVKQIEIAGKAGEIQAEGEMRQLDLFQNRQEHTQEIVQDEQVHDQEMRQREEVHDQEIRLQQSKGRADVAIAKAKATAAAKAKPTGPTQAG